jgi:hypothetical protein
VLGKTRYGHAKPSEVAMMKALMFAFGALAAVAFGSVSWAGCSYHGETVTQIDTTKTTTTTDGKPLIVKVQKPASTDSAN